MNNRIFYAVVAPIAALALAVGFSLLMVWIEQFAAGKVVMIALIFVILLRIAYMAYNWPGFNDDDA
jgi:hypothetical protein